MSASLKLAGELAIRKKCSIKMKDWKQSFLMTPSESLTERFAKLTRKRWGIIKGITDKNYIVNSFHVDIKEHINAFDKIKFEAQFHKISSGGCISYIEMPNMKNNEEAVLEAIKFIYDNSQYCEFNTKLDYCQVCGFEGEIICDDDLNWVCPECGNKDPNKMNILRRTCGLSIFCPRKI